MVTADHPGGGGSPASLSVTPALPLETLTPQDCGTSAQSWLGPRRAALVADMGARAESADLAGAPSRQAAQPGGGALGVPAVGSGVVAFMHRLTAESNGAMGQGEG